MILIAVLVVVVVFLNKLLMVNCLAKEIKALTSKV